MGDRDETEIDIGVDGAIGDGGDARIWTADCCGMARERECFCHAEQTR